MKVLLDNTLLHRVGAVLDAGPESPVAPIDLLATFHLAEHILFAEQVTVSAFERPETAERTAHIIDLLERRGLSGEGDERFITTDLFTAVEYESACDEASAAIQDELEDLSANDLRTWGAFADDAARPTGLPAFPFHELASQPFRRIEERRNAAQLLDLRAAGAFELTVLKNKALHARLSALNAEAALFDSRQSAALTVISRLKINQELARLRSALYAPAPQRARVSHSADQLFRYRLETMIEKSIAEGINSDRHGVVRPPQVSSSPALACPCISFSPTIDYTLAALSAGGGEGPPKQEGCSGSEGLVDRVGTEVEFGETKRAARCASSYRLLGLGPEIASGGRGSLGDRQRQSRRDLRG